MRVNRLYLDDALKVLENRRISNKRFEERRRDEILKKLPEYNELEIQLSRTMSDMISAVIDKMQPADVVSKEANEKNQAIQKRMNELLEENGYPADYLDPIFDCPICKDKGNTGSEWCECLCRLTNQMAADEFNENAPLERSRFDNFDIGRYSDKADKENNVSPKAMMQKNLEYCKRFADEFDGKGSGILMVGNTGLGKTHLSLAIANKLLKKGFCVVYSSATELIRKIRNEQFNTNEEGETMPLVKSCDLLILDDVGVEKSSDWSISVLYEIINSRQNKRAPMIISTNLDFDVLNVRYEDRLFSRMCSMKVLVFEGSDNRIAFSENYKHI